MVEKIERRDGAHSPTEMGHEAELHSLHCFGLEHVFGLAHLEVQERWDPRLLHFRRN